MGYLLKARRKDRELTAVDREVLAAIRELRDADDYGRTPSQQEIADHIGISRSRVQAILDRLDDGERIQRERYSARAIRILRSFFGLDEPPPPAAPAWSAT